MQLWVLFENCLFEPVYYVQCTVVIVGTHMIVERADVLFYLAYSRRYLSIHLCNIFINSEPNKIKMPIKVKLNYLITDLFLFFEFK